MLTCYDASFARLLDDAGVDCLLVGDSLGMVLQGQASTLPVTLRADGLPHRAAWRAATARAWIVGDLPFGSYQESREQAMRSAAALMQAGAQMVKLEGGGWTAETVRFLVERGMPVCAHLGLTPQSVHALGGYRVQGRDDEAARHAEAHMPRSWPTPARPCWCWSWCRAALAARGHRRRCPSDDRHRRRRRLQRPGAGAARHARPHRAASCRASCATSWQGSAGIEDAVPALRGGREGRQLPRRRTAQLLRSCHAGRPHHRRAARALWPRTAGRAFVPTMGNLHEGHLALVRRPGRMGDVTVASIFVNRLQFAPHEDFDTLPAHAASATAPSCWRRRLRRACSRPTSTSCTPSRRPSRCSPPAELADILEGHFRPGFFTGVCTVVMKLFSLRAAARRGVRQEGLPAADGDPPHGAAVRAAHRDRGRRDASAPPTAWRCRRATATCRAAEREEAVQLSLALQAHGAQVESGRRTSRRSKPRRWRLRARGWEPDYLTVRRRTDLQAPRCERSAGGAGRRAAGHHAADRQPGSLRDCHAGLDPASMTSFLASRLDSSGPMQSRVFTLYSRRGPNLISEGKRCWRCFR